MKNILHESASWFKLKSVYHTINNIANKEVKKLIPSLNHKLDQIIEGERITNVILPNPNVTIRNLSNRTLNNAELEVLSSGLKHGTAVKPTENNLFALAEDLYDQINWKVLGKENQGSVKYLQNTLCAFFV